MGAYLAVVSLRAVRKYLPEPLPDAVLTRILQAGRATGSASNGQYWRFYVIRQRAVLDQLAETVYEPDNLRGAPVALALVMTRPRSFDAGRAAQNLMLAAWAEGVGTSPNGLRKADEAKRLLDLEDDWEIATILSMGYPDEPLRPKRNDPVGILARINRKPLDELTHWID
jgi:nitroreductase